MPVRLQPLSLPAPKMKTKSLAFVLEKTVELLAAMTIAGTAILFAVYAYTGHR